MDHDAATQKKPEGHMWPQVEYHWSKWYYNSRQVSSSAVPTLTFDLPLLGRSLTLPVSLNISYHRFNDFAPGRLLP
ncbi:hypothetical protein TNCV_2458061 [Trichonephila clavipes]|nr:hypothetical protein TNCV_2458061 [Trichonephila clavipes]